MVYIVSVLVYKCHNHDNRWGRRAFVIVIVFIVIVGPPQGTKISQFSSSSSSASHSLSSSYSSTSTSSSLSTSSEASFLLLLLLLRRQWWYLDKYPPPQSHCWIMMVGYCHILFSDILSTYYGGITSLPMTFLSLLSQPLRYDGIDYDRNYLAHW